MKTLGWILLGAAAMAMFFLFVIPKKGKGKSGRDADRISDWKRSGTFLTVKFKDGSEYNIQG